MRLLHLRNADPPSSGWLPSVTSHLSVGSLGSQTHSRLWLGGSQDGTQVIRDSGYGFHSLSHILTLCSPLLNLPFLFLLYSQTWSELLSLMECRSYLILGSKSPLASHLIWKKSQNTMKSRPRVLYVIVPSALASLAVWLVLECWRPPRAFAGLLALTGFFWELCLLARLTLIHIHRTL